MCTTPLFEICVSLNDQAQCIRKLNNQHKHISSLLRHAQFPPAVSGSNEDCMKKKIKKNVPVS